MEAIYWNVRRGVIRIVRYLVMWVRCFVSTRVLMLPFESTFESLVPWCTFIYSCIPLRRALLGGGSLALGENLWKNDDASEPGSQGENLSTNDGCSIFQTRDNRINLSVVVCFAISLSLFTKFPFLIYFHFTASWWMIIQLNYQFECHLIRPFDCLSGDSINLI